MKNILQFIKNRPWRTVSIVAGVVLLLVILIGGDRGPLYEEYVVDAAELEQIVLISGAVDSQSAADLSFGQAGSVQEILKRSGDVVVDGDVIARIASAGAQGELLQARAALEKAEANLAQLLDGARPEEVAVRSGAVDSARLARDNALQKLQNTQNQQDALVENAYKTLLSSGLEAKPVGGNSSGVSVTISGYYDSLESGQYTISTYGSSGGVYFNLSGLESGTGSASATAATALGTRGLFVSFSTTEGIANRSWSIAVPNTQSSLYPANFAAYNNALQSRTVAVANAQADYDNAEAAYQNAQRDLELLVAAPLQTDVALLQSDITSARGRLLSAQKTYNDTIIRAPFDGVVGRVDLSVGDLVQRDTPYVSVVGYGDLEVVLQVPQIDVARIAVGDTTDIVLDAYGDDEFWQGEIIYIDSVDTQIEGVSVYETRVRIIEPDQRIRIGMTAKARIVVAQEQVDRAVPAHFISRDGQTKYVLMYNQDQSELVRRTVTTGLESGDGLVEIKTGLQAGDVIVREL